MSNKGAITIKIGEAFVELITDGRKLTAGLNDAEKQVIASTNAMSQKFKAVGTIMTVVGGAITASLGLIIKKTVDAGDAYNDMSLRTGVAVETLSALAYVAKQSGTDIEGLELGIKFLTKGMDDASKGTGTAKDAFTELGISVKDSEDKLRPTIDVLKEAATKIAAIKNPAEQAALAMQLFGARSGTQLVPLLKLGGAGIDELMKKAEELGIVISTKDARAADEFKDSMNTLKESLGAVGRDIANVLIPPLLEFTNKAIEIIKKVRDWADAHKPLVDILIKVGATIGALAAVGGPILLAVSAFMKMIPAIQAVQTALLSLASGGTYGLIITAVAAFVLAYKNNFLGLKTWADNMWEKLKAGWINYCNFIHKITADIAEFFITDKMAAAESAKNIDLFGKSTEELLKKTEELTPAFQLVASASGTLGAGLKAVNENIYNVSQGFKEAISTIKDDFLVMMSAINDKIYEFTHNEMDIKLRDINREFDAYIDKAKKAFLTEKELVDAIKRINEARQLEIDALKGSNIAKDEIIVKDKELIASTKEVIEVAKETGEVIKGAGILGGQGWDNLTITIKRSSVALSNFNKEAVAAAIAIVKMKFFEIWGNLAEDLRKAGYYSGLIQAQYNEALKTMNEQIKTILYGYKEYQKILASLGGGGTIPSYQTGTPYVPKTGLYQLHQGEAVIPANQNTYNNSFSPIVNLNVSGGGNAQNIAFEVKKVLDDSARQFRRSGFELVPGRG